MLKTRSPPFPVGVPFRARGAADRPMDPLLLPSLLRSPGDCGQTQGDAETVVVLGGQMVGTCSGPLTGNARPLKPRVVKSCWKVSQDWWLVLCR